MAEESSKGRVIAVWVLCGLLAAEFVWAGGNKVFGSVAAHGAEHFGYTEGFMRFIGLCELAGAAGLLVPRLSTWAASGLLLVLCGAVYSHLTHDPIADAVPAFVTLVLLGVVAWLRRDQALFLAQPATSAAA